MRTSSDSSTTKNVPTTSGLQASIRVLWMLVGNIVLGGLAISIYHDKRFISGLDAAFVITVLCLLALRYVDLRFLNGRTATNEPATPGTYPRYAIALVAIAAALILAAHLVP